MAAKAVEEKEAKETPKPARPVAKKPLSEEARWLIGGLAVTGPASGLVYRDEIESWVYDNRIWLLGIAVLLIGSCVLAMTRAYRRARGPRQRKRTQVVSAFASEGLHDVPPHAPWGPVRFLAPARFLTRSPQKSFKAPNRKAPWAPLRFLTRALPPRMGLRGGRPRPCRERWPRRSRVMRPPSWRLR